MSSVSKKILVAINNDVLRNVYSELLAKDAFVVLKTKNGTEAYDLVIKEKPAVILADTILEEIGGFTLLKKIRENEATKRIPVLIFSQYESNQERREAMELEASEYMGLSNVPPTEVVSRIKILLGEQKSYRIGVTEDTKGIKELMDSLLITDLECPTCHQKKELLLIKDLSNGNSRFIASFVCPNNC